MRDRQSVIAYGPVAELDQMRCDRRGTLRRFALIEPRMRQHAPEGNRLPVARHRLGRRAEPGAVAPEATVPTAAPLATAAAFRARAQGHPVFAGLTQARMRDTFGALQQIVGPSGGLLRYQSGVALS